MAIVTKTPFVTDDLGGLLPSGHTIATAAGNIGTLDIKNQTLSFNLVASGSAASTAVAAFNDLIGTDLVAQIDDYLTNTLNLDIVAHNFNYSFQVTSVSRDNILLNDATGNFVVKGILNVAAT